MFSAGAIGAHFSDRYTPRIGDTNGDGRPDIFLQFKPDFVPITFDDMIVPIPVTGSGVGEFVLEQNAAGGFELRAPVSSAQRSTAMQSPSAQLTMQHGDYNADGQLDVLIRGSQSGMPGAQDAFVFAPLDNGAPPLAVSNIDATRSLCA